MTQKEFDEAIAKLEDIYHEGMAVYAEQNNLLKKELDSIQKEYHQKVKDVQQRMRNVNFNIELVMSGYLRRMAEILAYLNTPNSEA